jgi:hypothetical protein
MARGSCRCLCARRAIGAHGSFRLIVRLAEGSAEHASQLPKLPNPRRERKAVAVDLAAYERKERSQLIFCEVLAGHAARLMMAAALLKRRLSAKSAGRADSRRKGMGLARGLLCLHRGRRVIRSRGLYRARRFLHGRWFVWIRMPRRIPRPRLVSLAHQRKAFDLRHCPHVADHIAFLSSGCGLKMRFRRRAVCGPKSRPPRPRSSRSW